MQWLAKSGEAVKGPDELQVEEWTRVGMGGRKKKNKNRQHQDNQSGPAPAPTPDRRPNLEDKKEGSPDAGAAPISSTTTAAAAVPPAAAFVMECEVCQEKFDRQSHKPRNLVCGHAFCSDCCKQLLNQQSIPCPKCRTITPVKSVGALSVNYPIMDILEGMDVDTTETASMKKDKGDKGSSWVSGIFSGRQKKEEISPHRGKCLEAQAEVAMHCAHCNLWLCKDCSRIDHRRPECVLVPYQDTLKEMGQIEKAKMKVTQEALEDFYCEANEYGCQLTSCATILEIALDCIKKEQSHLPNVLIHARKLQQGLSDSAVKRIPDDLEDALYYLETLQTVTQAAEQWAANASTSVLKVDQVFRLSKTLLQTAVQLHGTASEGIMGQHSVNGIDMTLPVDMDGSRMLVHAVQRSAPNRSCRLVKLAHIMSCIDPSSALTFLDISLRGQELGRVFIRLLCGSKRSRSFLMMCTGEGGPSFRNTPFHRVCWEGKPGEHLWSGDYDHADGSGGSLPKEIQDQTKELWNEKTQVLVASGLVAGRYGNHNSTIFRVYTRDSPDVKEEFALGRVEYGLEVFKDALKKYNNITHLMISDCGIVVEP